MNADPATDPWGVEARPVLVTPFGVAELLLKRWRLLIGLPTLMGALVLGAALLFPGYKAESRFVPQGSDMDLSALSGLATDFGFSLPSSGGESPDFYVALVGSGEILTRAAVTHFEVARDYDDPQVMSGRLMDLLKIKGDTEDERLRAAVDDLKDRVSSSANAKSGMVAVKTQTPYPILSEALNRKILDLLEVFDRERQQAQAKAERTFIESRLAEVSGELETAENAVTAFLSQNRRPDGSALLEMELDRLKRDVSLRQSVYSTLAEAFEQARLEEVRNTPVLTIVDRPEGTSRRTLGPKLALVLGGLAGGVLAISILVGQAYFAGRRQTLGPVTQEDTPGRTNEPLVTTP
ncbi:MAG: hypothetical protein ACR2QM_16735 [Longimicrobiales bacterium]